MSQHDLAAKSYQAHNCEVRFRNNYTAMIIILRRRVVCNIWAATLKVKVTALPSAKSCPAHNFVIWSQILQLFYIIDHHIDTTCCAQHLGRYLEGQGHSMTFQHNCVRPITLLFEVRFRKYFTEMITMLRRCVAHKFGSLPWRSRSQYDFSAK